MRILVTPTSFFKEQNRTAIDRLEAFCGDIVKNPLSRPLEAGEILPLLEGVEGYIAGLDYITADVILNAPACLKVISRYGAGVDRVDLEAAKKRGINVTNTPGTNARAVCELAFGLMLALSRNIPGLDSAVKNGEWPRYDGRELYGARLGVVGFGAIGRELAARAVAFGMEVVAYDPYFNPEAAERLGVKQSGLDDLFASCDYVSLHLPLNDETRRIVDGKRLGMMKKGALLVNTARGGLVDERAAAVALESGGLGGLALDVFEKEPVTASPLIGLPNVIMTPHTGAHTREAIGGMGLMAVDNLICELSGGDCGHRV